MELISSSKHLSLILIPTSSAGIFRQGFTSIRTQGWQEILLVLTWVFPSWNCLCSETFPNLKLANIQHVFPRVDINDPEENIQLTLLEFAYGTEFDEGIKNKKDRLLVQVGIAKYKVIHLGKNNINGVRTLSQKQCSRKDWEGCCDQSKEHELPDLYCAVLHNQRSTN